MGGPLTDLTLMRTNSNRHVKVERLKQFRENIKILVARLTVVDSVKIFEYINYLIDTCVKLI